MPGSLAVRPPYDPDEPDRVDRVEAGWRRERPDIDVSSVGIVRRIWRIGRHLDRHGKERLEALDVLSMLRRAGCRSGWSDSRPRG